MLDFDPQDLNPKDPEAFIGRNMNIKKLCMLLCLAEN
jgi:hypothetical protein